MYSNKTYTSFCLGTFCYNRLDRYAYWSCADNLLYKHLETFIMNRVINYYNEGSSLASSRKLIKDRFFSVNRKTPYAETLAKDLRSNFSRISSLQNLNYVNLSLAITWLFDNDYLLFQRIQKVTKTLKEKNLKELSRARFGDVEAYQIEQISKVYLELNSYEFDSKSFREFVNGYQSLYPLRNVEIWMINPFIQLTILKRVIHNTKLIIESLEGINVAYEIFKEIDQLIAKGKRSKAYKYLQTRLETEFVDLELFLELNKIINDKNKYLSDITDLIDRHLYEHNVNIKEFYKVKIQKELKLRNEIENNINSLRYTSEISWEKMFESLSHVEKNLLQDPNGIYPRMTDLSKNQYRKEIEALSKYSKYSEVEVSKRLVELVTTANLSDSDLIGQYLFKSQKKKLMDRISYDPPYRVLLKDVVYKYPLRFYVTFIALLTTLSVVAFVTLLSTNILLLALLVIFSSQISLLITNFIVTNSFSPSPPPALKLENVTSEHKTLVVVPCLVGSVDKIKHLCDELELRYLQNQEDNIYYALLTDYEDAGSERLDTDEVLLTTLTTQFEKLNERYNNKFFLFHRNRLFNEMHKKWICWERKRGKLLVLNEFLVTGVNSFDYTVGDLEQLTNTKYVITLDEDTSLPLDTAKELIGAIAHPLNKPYLNPKTNTVTSGYGILQPRIATKPIAATTSLYARIFNLTTGLSQYSNTVSDVYQDIFNRTIFQGKGIYDVEAVHKVLHDRLPDNSILSHDLLESCYVNAGYASYITLMENFPTTVSSELARTHRWIRGDWQLIPWLKQTVNTRFGKEPNPLNNTSKWLIIDNLRRSLVVPSLYILLLFSLATASSSKFLLLLFLTPAMLQLVDVFKIREVHIPFKSKIAISIVLLRNIFIKAFYEIVFIPKVAFSNLDAIIRTLIRLIRRRNLLEWSTFSSQASGQGNYIDFTFIANFLVILFILSVGQGYLMLSFAQVFLIVFWLLYEVFNRIFSKPLPHSSYQISAEESAYLFEIGRSTWQMYEDYCTEESNYLPPDNVQFKPVIRSVNRTSSTNIGFYILSIVSAYDLKYINESEAVSKIKNVTSTIKRLPKFKGNLYNWYDINTLQPLGRYISSVDSGNFVACLISTVEFLKGTDQTSAKHLISTIERLIYETDFTFLYNEDMDLFSIGYNAASQQRDSSNYDLLISESRTLSYIAVAIKQVTKKHWAALGRPFGLNGTDFHLLSWGGTAFENTLPSLFFDETPNTLIHETNKVSYTLQKSFGEANNIPWGVSEAAYNIRDLGDNYQYKMFGLPKLSLAKYSIESKIVSAYSVFLYLKFDIKEGISNLAKISELGGRGKYGFFDSLDFINTPHNTSCTPVMTFMAHHQGMILVAINNVLNKDINIKRFSNSSVIKSAASLLQETNPIVSDTVPPTEMIKNESFSRMDFGENYRFFDTPFTNLTQSHVYASNRMQLVLDNRGNSYLKFDDINVTRQYEDTLRDKYGKFIYIKNKNSGEKWSNTYSPLNKEAQEYKVNFYNDQASFFRKDNDISIQTNIFLPPEYDLEVREIIITNTGRKSVELELTSFEEITMDLNKNTDAHPTFNKMFVETFLKDDILVASRRKRKPEDGNRYSYSFVYDGKRILHFEEYETDRSRFLGRNRSVTDPIALDRKLQKSSGTVLEPIFSIRTSLAIQPSTEAKLYYITGFISDLNQLDKIREIFNYEMFNIYDLDDATKNYNKAQLTNLGISERKEMLFQETISRMLDSPSDLRSSRPFYEYPNTISDLYKMGISGENHAIVVKVTDKNNFELVKNSLSMHEYFRRKNFYYDLIIVADEELSYKYNLVADINYIIKNSPSNDLLGKENGIFLINSHDFSKNDLDLIEYVADLILYSELGSLREHINLTTKSGQEVLQLSSNNASSSYRATTFVEDGHNLDLFNGYGGFSHDGEFYEILNPLQTPLPWSNIIASSDFGTMLTETGLGYTWFQNSQLNKLTPWYNDPISNPSGEIIYAVVDGTITSLTPYPLFNGKYKTVHTQGYTEYTNVFGNIEFVTKVFISPEKPVKFYEVTFKNLGSKDIKIDFIYFADFVLDSGLKKSIKGVNAKVNFQSNCIFAFNKLNASFKSNVAFITCDTKVTGFNTSKRRFFGIEKDVNKPVWAFSDETLVRATNPINMCGALKVKKTLKYHAQDSITFMLGQAINKEQAASIVEDIGKKGFVEREFINSTTYWREKTKAITINTANNQLNYLVNHWLLYQTISCRINARAGFYQAGGAYGFRDQLQDCMSLVYTNPLKLREMILFCAARQYVEGDVQHWWHAQTGAGVRTKISDDRLWLPYVTAFYIHATGDNSILTESVSYLTSRILGDDEESRYEIPEVTTEKESIEQHCIKAIDISLQFGTHGIPLIGTGDWNDGMDSVGDKGKGESVWLGWLLYATIVKFFPFISNVSVANKYKKTNLKLKEALNLNGYSGEWFLRAFDDEGNALGDANSLECKIDSISQSWSVISGAADKEKSQSAMENHKKYLEDQETKLIKLLTPPFQDTHPFPGYIQGYPVGIRENGGQYTHGVIWSVKAYALLDRMDDAYRVLEYLNPLNHSTNKEQIDQYKTEPYAMVADIYTNPNHYGRGGWSWYTGSSGWMLQVIMQDILGINKANNSVTIQPGQDIDGKKYTVEIINGDEIIKLDSDMAA